MPNVVWKGLKIRNRLIEYIVFLMARGYEEFRRETMVDLLYHRRRGWALSVPLQAACAGLSVYRIPYDASETRGLGPLASKDLAEFYNREGDHAALTSKGWTVLGSVHHHCSAGAGQSAADFDDEINRPGLHITLGSLSSVGSYSVHMRYIHKGVQYTIDPASILETPELLSRPVRPNAVMEHWYRTRSRNTERVKKIEDLPNKYVAPVTTSWHSQEGFDYWNREWAHKPPVTQPPKPVTPPKEKAKPTTTTTKRRRGRPRKQAFGRRGIQRFLRSPITPVSHPLAHSVLKLLSAFQEIETNENVMDTTDFWENVKFAIFPVPEDTMDQYTDATNALMKLPVAVLPATFHALVDDLPVEEYEILEELIRAI